MRKCYLLIAVTVLIGAGGYFLLPDRGQRDPDLLAKVGSREIRVDRLLAEAERRRGFMAEKIDKHHLLEEIVRFEALVDRAIALGLDRDPEVVRSFQNMLIGKLKERQLTPALDSIAVSDEEIQARYAADRKKYETPPAARLAMIFFHVEQGASAENRSLLREKMTLIRKEALTVPVDEGFGTVAAKYSEEPATRYKGGMLGWLTEGQADTRCDKAVLAKGFSLNIGDVSDIIVGADGLYLIRLVEKKAAETVPIDAVREKIRYTLAREKRMGEETSFERKALSAAKVQMFPEALEKVELPEMERLATVPIQE